MSLPARPAALSVRPFAPLSLITTEKQLVGEQHKYTKKGVNIPRFHSSRQICLWGRRIDRSTCEWIDRRYCTTLLRFFSSVILCRCVNLLAFLARPFFHFSYFGLPQTQFCNADSASDRRDIGSVFLYFRTSRPTFYHQPVSLSFLTISCSSRSGTWRGVDHTREKNKETQCKKRGRERWSKGWEYFFFCLGG